MKITLTKQEKEKYKQMEIEEIIKDIDSRTKAPKQELIECAKWIMEESRK